MLRIVRDFLLVGMTDHQTDPVDIRIQNLKNIIDEDVLSATEIMSRMGLHIRRHSETIIRGLL